MHSKRRFHGGFRFVIHSTMWLNRGMIENRNRSRRREFSTSANSQRPWFVRQRGVSDGPRWWWTCKTIWPSQTLLEVVTGSDFSVRSSFMVILLSIRQSLQFMMDQNDTKYYCHLCTTRPSLGSIKLVHSRFLNWCVRSPIHIQQFTNHLIDLLLSWFCNLSSSRQLLPKNDYLLRDRIDWFDQFHNSSIWTRVRSLETRICCTNRCPIHDILEIR
jgi:hypothetical protein